MPAPAHSIEVAIAALGDGINDVISRHLPLLASAAVDVLVVHQTAGHPAATGLDQMARYLPRDDLGLSRSRNAALDAASGDILVLADDDSAFLPAAFDRIRDAYQRHPDATAITFRAAGDTRWPEDFEHTARTVGQVYSLLITLRPDAVRRLGVRFDERFGLGATWPQGEDNILLADLRRAGGTVIAVPERIIPDPGETSGDLFTPDRITTKVVVARRMFGWWAGPLIAVQFAWTKRSRYRAQGVSLREFTRAAWRGLRIPLFQSPGSDQRKSPL